jgi:ribosomal protein S12 methylthiotransferase accessory factor
LAGRTPKGFRNGTHRLIEPEVTITRARRVAPALGITRVANVTGLDTIGIPVVMVCRPNSRSLAVSQGKGLDLAAATASGLMESVEAYHAEHISLPLKYASFEQLRYTHPIVNLDGLPRTSDTRFTPERQLLWIEGRDLAEGDAVWLPFETVSLDYTVPFPPGSGCFGATGNGLASGNHLLEAISHALCEVIERDATTLWSLLGDAGQPATRLDLSTVSDPACQSVLELYERANIEVAVWDMTTDIGVACFLCQIADRTDERLHALYPSAGCGCHPTRNVALLRALTEAAQSRLTLISGARDDCIREDYERLRSPDTLRGYYASIGGRDRPRRYQDVASFESDTFEEDIGWLLGRLRAVGIEQVTVVDLTRAELGLPVARVVVPGLEGPEDRLPGYLWGRRAQKVIERVAA